ncbi:type II toxin-antitoxin system PemK/MazF family toxin [Sphingomonas sp.]|uniref:type II toxin-antitoxin system PemK/MazF family toxin n=1 Tax=Sphingomonas sp. TaxID=28214 RepID=UPI0035BC67C4
MKRGDYVIVADRDGDFSGKPRPALIVQSDLFNDTHQSVTVCLITTELTGMPMYRVPVAANDRNGLLRDSEVAVDKLQAVWTHRVSRVIGKATNETLIAVESALRTWLTL